MGKKDKEKSSKKPAENEDVKREQKLQAIILADSFTKTFRPITWEKPRVLLPLANVPMIEYTLEFLAQNGVEEVFVFCVSFAEAIQDYLNNTTWLQKLSVKCITSNACLSAGDALREIDSMGVIRSDPFILINGDVVSNMDLKKAMKFHKDTRKMDSNAIMTCVLKQVPRTAGPKPILDDLTVVLDKSTQQVLYFEDEIECSNVNFPVTNLTDHPAVTFHSDLLDCHIDICSPELLLQFSDNFDYQNIRRDFIHNEVVNYELGMHIYGYIIQAQNEYAARVQDLKTYHAISKDILHRWCYPHLPPHQLCTGNQYRGRGVIVSPSAKVGAGVLGAGVRIGDGAVIDGCVIGDGVNIEAGAVLKHSHVWHGATIKAGAKIVHSVICDGAVVGENAVLERGCVLSYGVVIGADVTVPEFTRISLHKKAHDDDVETDYEPAVQSSSYQKSSMMGAFDREVVGAGGKGFVWEAGGDGNISDDEESPLKDVDVVRACSIGCTELELWKRSLWATLPAVEEPSNDVDLEQFEDLMLDASHFKDTVSDMITTGYAEKHPPDNVILEIKGYKFAQNKEFHDCIAGVVPALLRICCGGDVLSQSGIAQFLGMVKEDAWGHKILVNMVQDENDELHVIEAVEDYLLLPSVKDNVGGALRLILHTLYNSDLLSEETILRWASTRSSQDGNTAYSGKVALYKQDATQAFLEWLRQEDESSEEGSEEEESD